MQRAAIYSAGCMLFSMLTDLSLVWYCEGTPAEDDATEAAWVGLLLAASEFVLQHKCASKFCFECLQAQASSLGGTMLHKWPQFQFLRNEFRGTGLSAELDVVMDLLGAMCSLQPEKRPTLQALLQNPHLIGFSQKFQSYS